MAKFKLIITHYKLLLAVKELNDCGFYPNSEGIYKMLTGVYDIDTQNFTANQTYGLLISYSQKRITRMLDMLVKRDFLRELYDPKTKNVFLQISDNGEDALGKFMKKRKTLFVKKKHKINRCIVEIK